MAEPAFTPEQIAYLRSKGMISDDTASTMLNVADISKPALPEWEKLPETEEEWERAKAVERRAALPEWEKLPETEKEWRRALAAKRGPAPEQFPTTPEGWRRALAAEGPMPDIELGPAPADDKLTRMSQEDLARAALARRGR